MESGTSIDGHRDDFLWESNMQVSTSTAVKEPTCNEFLESKASIVGWESIRKKIQAAITEMATLPLNYPTNKIFYDTEPLNKSQYFYGLYFT